jgi:hypothetical protein
MRGARGHRHGAAPLAGDEAARQLGELHQAELLEKIWNGRYSPNGTR